MPQDAATHPMQAEVSNTAADGSGGVGEDREGDGAPLQQRVQAQQLLRQAVPLTVEVADELRLLRAALLGAPPEVPAAAQRTP